MSAGDVYGISGKVFIGPITAVDGTGGEEIKGIEGRRFEFDTGFVLETVKDQEHHDVVKMQNGPGILNVPMHDVDDAVIAELLRPLFDSGTAINPHGAAAAEIYEKLPSIPILVLPQDDKGGTVRAIFIKAAKLHPETLRTYNLSLDAPLLPENALFIATSVQGDDGDPPWMIARPVDLTTQYF